VTLSCSRKEFKRVRGQRAIIPIGQIEQLILLIRGQRIMLDADLAMLYGVPTRVLNQAVRRNAKRFPQDFMFKLTQSEKNEVITICDHLKNLKYAKALPNAFTEHGAIMPQGQRPLLQPKGPLGRFSSSSLWKNFHSAIRIPHSSIFSPYPLLLTTHVL